MNVAHGVLVHTFLPRKKTVIFLLLTTRSKQRAGGLDKVRGWRLRYMLTDVSPAEQPAAELAFGGLNVGEWKVTHLFVFSTLSKH